MGVEVVDHRQLREAEIADDVAGSDREAGEGRADVRHLVEDQHRIGLDRVVGRRVIDDVVGGDREAVTALQQLDESGVELRLAGHRELELFAGGSLARGAQRKQQHGRGRCCCGAHRRPRRHAPREVERAQAALFEVLDGLRVDRAHAARRVGAQFVDRGTVR